MYMQQQRTHDSAQRLPTRSQTLNFQELEKMDGAKRRFESIYHFIQTFL